MIQEALQVSWCQQGAVKQRRVVPFFPIDRPVWIGEGEGVADVHHRSMSAPYGPGPRFARSPVKRGAKKAPRFAAIRRSPERAHGAHERTRNFANLCRKYEDGATPPLLGFEGRAAQLQSLPGPLELCAEGRHCEREDTSRCPAIATSAAHDPPVT